MPDIHWHPPMKRKLFFILGIHGCLQAQYPMIECTPTGRAGQCPAPTCYPAIPFLRNNQKPVCRYGFKQRSHRKMHRGRFFGLTDCPENRPLGLCFCPAGAGIIFLTIAGRLAGCSQVYGSRLKETGDGSLCPPILHREPSPVHLIKEKPRHAVSLLVGMP